MGENISSIIKRARLGEQQAWNDIDRIFRPKIHAFCKNWFKNSSDAEEATQEVFLQCYRKLELLDDEEKFEAWLYSIARNKCNDIGDKKKRSPVEVGNSDDDGVMPFSVVNKIDGDIYANPEMNYEINDQYKILLSLLDTIPEEQKFCFVQRVLLDKPFKEIAQLAGISESTAKSRYRYAKKAMRDVVGKYEKRTKQRLHRGLYIFPVYLFRRPNGKKGAAAFFVGEFAKVKMASVIAGILLGITAATAGTVLMVNSVFGNEDIIPANNGYEDTSKDIKNDEDNNKFNDSIATRDETVVETDTENNSFAEFTTASNVTLKSSPAVTEYVSNVVESVTRNNEVFETEITSENTAIQQSTTAVTLSNTSVTKETANTTTSASKATTTTTATTATTVSSTTKPTASSTATTSTTTATSTTTSTTTSISTTTAPTEDPNKNLFGYSILDDGTIEITEYKGTNKNVTIPNKIEGYTVTRIGEKSFEGCNCEQVTLPSTLKSIGSKGFSNSNLLEITVPDSVTEIENGAFSYCGKLKRVVLSNNIEKIDNNLFFNCESLEDINIPVGVTEIYPYSFGYCKSLTSIAIPDGCLDLYSSAFTYCTSLKKVTLPNTPIYIDMCCFMDCSSLEAVENSDNISLVFKTAFGDCEKLESISLKNASVISETAFANCENLKEITLSNKTKRIDHGAFANCTSLVNIYFDGTKSDWDEILISDENEPIQNANIYYMQNEYLYNILENGTLEISGCIGDNKDLVIPDTIDGRTVTSIGEKAFYGCNIKSVVFPNTLTTIKDEAFRNNNLKDNGITNYIKIPDSVTDIGAFANCTSLREINTLELAGFISPEAFANCTSIEAVSLKNISNIKSATFIGCTALKELYLSHNIVEIGESAFYNCTSLTDVYYDDTEEKWNNLPIEMNNAPLKNATIHYK